MVDAVLKRSEKCPEVLEIGRGLSKSHEKCFDEFSNTFANVVGEPCSHMKYWSCMVLLQKLCFINCGRMFSVRFVGEDSRIFG